MNKAVAKEWVDALRSGKYKQTKKKLRDGDRMCCLGVLCDVVKGRVQGEWQGDTFVSGQSCDLMPPSDVVRLVGLTGDDAGHPYPDRYSDMNDDKGKSFLEIADAIEADFGLKETA